MWAGPPSWDPIVLGEDEEDDDDDSGYAYGDIKWVLPREVSTQYCKGSIFWSVARLCQMFCSKLCRQGCYFGCHAAQTWSRN